MSYTIEVYRGVQKAERHFGIYALYVMFYPQLVAGPIERPQNILYQFYEKHYFNIQRVLEGLKIMCWGLFKKVVIADRLTIYVDQVYNHPNNHHGFELIVATLFFAVQIYCDFSGYSDIAIGAAKVMGFDLMINFRKPYFSKSIGEFWGRWHISLSTWFRDYLYIPLGGSRVIKSRLFFNLLVTFLISGIWHGANWTFVIWGLLNGIYLIVEIVFSPKIKAAISTYGLSRFSWLTGALSRVWTLSLICFAWIFFRANNLGQSIYIVKNLGTGLKDTLYIFREKLAYFVLIILFFLIEYLQKNFTYSPHLSPARTGFKKVWNFSLYAIFIWSIVVFGEYGSKQFIYFQF
jgi:D-alanyl-lipoteichoic acid acyltransferase DltB (MBOAT superfamily)